MSEIDCIQYPGEWGFKVIELGGVAEAAFTIPIKPGTDSNTALKALLLVASYVHVEGKL